MRLLVLLPRFPFPLDKGDKLRAYYQIQYLSRFHEITLIHFESQPTQDQLEALAPYCNKIVSIPTSPFQKFCGLIRAFVKGLPLQNGFFYAFNAYKTVNQVINEMQPDHIYCQMLRVAEWVEKTPITKTLDFQDVLSVGFLRRRDKARPLFKPLFNCEYERLKKYEAKLANIFNHLTIITSVDRDLLPFDHKNEVVVVPNGVQVYGTENKEKEFDIIFSGNMSYPPNVDASIYLVEKILPLVKSAYPFVKMAIVGTDPAPSVQRLASENVIVTGCVPSLQPYYQAAKIFVAPMQLGTGLQNKILEAMANQIPVVVSPLAGNSLIAANNGEHLILAQTPQEFAKNIVNLLTDEKLANHIALHGFEYVQKHYNWDVNNEILNKIMKK